MTVTDRFLKKVAVLDDPSACWRWKASKHTKGYGQFWTGEKMVRAHRFAYEHWVGPIPDGVLVCHRCDNRACVNPSHLFLGTNQDNIQDMVLKGRVTRKLTDDQIRAIRTAEGTNQEVATLFGVHRTLVGKIRNRRIWVHV